MAPAAGIEALAKRIIGLYELRAALFFYCFFKTLQWLGSEKVKHFDNGFWTSQSLPDIK